MEITIKRTALKRAIGYVYPAAKKRWIGISACANTHRVTLTGRGIGIEAEALIADATVTASLPAPVWIEAGWLRDIANASTDDDIAITVGNTQIDIRCGATMYGTTCSEEPPILCETWEGADTLRVDPERFADALNRTAYAMADNDVRFYLNGMALEYTAAGCVLTATDGSRLATVTLPVVAATLPVDGTRYILPRELVTLMQGKYRGAVHTVRIRHPYVECVCATGTVRGTLIDGKFPDYERVIPEYQSYIDIDGKALHAAVASVTPTSQRRAVKSGGLTLTGTADSARITLDVVGGGTTYVDARRVEAEKPIDVPLSLVYLYQCTRATAGEELRIGYRDERSAVLFASDDARHVVMPMRR